ncbi:MAG: copper chaperone PCu(A)C [Alphaproteobacteria bacterium]
MSLLALALSTAATAGEIKQVGDIEVDTPWARASVGTSRPAAAYLTIRNAGDRADRLLAVESPLAGHVMVHASTQQDGIMKMTPLDVLDLPAQGEVNLAPGGTHIMLMDLQQPLEEGRELPLRLILERAGVIEVSARIGSLAARTPPD